MNAKIGLLLGLVIFAGEASAAAIMYGAVGRGSPVNSGGLLTVDQTNGSGVLVGVPISPGGLTGLDFASSGALYGSTIDGPSGNRVSNLASIDANTGALLTSVPITAGGVAISIGDLAIQPGTNTIFGVHSNSDGTGLAGGLIYTIDTVTGNAILVGDTGQGRNGGLAFAPDGKLYFLEFNQLHELDPSTAAILSTIDLNFGSHDGLAIRSDGVFFATRAGAGTLGDEIRIVDPLLGTSTLVGQTGAGNASDLAFRPMTVPEPATLGLLGLALAGLGLMRRKRAV